MSLLLAEQVKKTVLVNLEVEGTRAALLCKACSTCRGPGARASLPSHCVPVLSSRHALVVFGGLEGLEAGVDVDPNLEITDPSDLFDFYLNTCPSQGSRTIRTEVGQAANGVAGRGACVHSAAFLSLAGTHGPRVLPRGDASAKSSWLGRRSSGSSGSDCRPGLFQEALLISLSALRPHIDEAVKTPSDNQGKEEH